MGWGHSLGQFFSDSFAQAKSHEPGWIQRLPSMPGSPQSLQDAFIKNKWNSPYGKEQNSADIFAGGVGHPLGSQNAGNRTIGRGVGSYFTGKGLDALTGGSGGGSIISGMRNMFGGGNSSGGNQTPGSDNGSGMTGVRGQTPSSIFEAAPSLMAGAMGNPDLYNANAEDLKKKGRYGDDNLLHVSDDELNQLKSTGKITQNPETGLPEAFSLGGFFGGEQGGGGGILGPIGNLIGGNQNRQDLSGIANQASNASNPLAAPQRQQYQQQLAGMMTPEGASNFMQNDPSIQAQRRMIGDQMGATFAHSGNMPLTSIMGSAQLANAFGGQYNQRIQDLGMLGGFNQGNPYGGMPYSSLIGPINQQNAGIMGSFGGMIPMLSRGLGGMFGGGNSGTGQAPEGFLGGNYPTDQYDF